MEFNKKFNYDTKTERKVMNRMIVGNQGMRNEEFYQKFYFYFKVGVKTFFHIHQNAPPFHKIRTSNEL